MKIEIGQFHLISNLGTNYSHPKRISRLQDLPRNLQKDGWDPLKLLKRLETMNITSSCLKNVILVEEQEEWEVARVLDSKLKTGKQWYLVKWEELSEDPERPTWEPASKLTNSPDLVKDFQTLYPDNPGSDASRDLFMVFGGE
ncbi:hypothetical protein O181_007067 [Austropuccinia psidii MF-1]|uniref:Chromo domain-containing protein n=1 Tax=Austropuccinia psidii MF-1 TaxID=1389203 RepID=A0A9Q3GI48_9BASI|nr:hypothetical protein [Austropuccinia psidii MF-1]